MNIELNNQFIWQFLTIEQAEFAAQSVLDIYRACLDDGAKDIESLQTQTNGKILMLCDLCHGFYSSIWIDRIWQITKLYQFPVETESGDSARLPASASETAEPRTVYDSSAEAGQGGNQTCPDCYGEPSPCSKCHSSPFSYHESYDEALSLHQVICFTTPAFLMA